MMAKGKHLKHFLNWKYASKIMNQLLVNDMKRHPVYTWIHKQTDKHLNLLTCHRWVTTKDHIIFF